MIGILILVSILLLIYCIAIRPYNFWSKRNVKTGSIMPVLGDNYLVLLGKESFAEMFQRLYNQVSDVRYFGTYQFLTPHLVLKSPELIKRICVKDFDHFLDHRLFFPSDVDEIWSKNLFALKGQAWRNMRITLSPSFTSSKMKIMFILICQRANLFTQYFLKKEEKLIQLEMKDAVTRYANDVIASTAFGIEIDSLGDKNNDFYRLGIEAITMDRLKAKLIFFLYQILPNLSKFLGLEMFSREVRDFFMEIVRKSIEMREKQNIHRPDMLQLLMEARKGQKKDKVNDEIKDNSFAAVEEYLESDSVKVCLTDADIASQFFIFFFAGFETVSSAICFMAYELALNTEIQKKLIEEIDKNKPENGSLSYETLINMEYMDMVVSETLRKWPTGITDRIVTKPYTIEPELPDEEPLHLHKNLPIWIPILAIHRDPKYYENPDKFDPERFSKENRKNIDPYTYLPFGVGPRNCIGSRFALLEIKAAIFSLLSDFQIVPTQKTEIPIKISKNSFDITAENGFHLGLRRRL